MVAPRRSRYRTCVSWWAVNCLLLCAVVGQAEEFRLESVGARGGLPANSSSSEFRQAEIFANWNLPWGWDLGKQWRLQSRLDFSAGWLGDQGDNAAIGTAGPTVVLSRGRLPVSLEAGLSPTLLSRSEFPSKNLGMDFQFTGHVGLNWDFATHWRLSYRYQHMSNADLAPQNPGLNLHMFGLSYVF
jgi:lipid A 3-O-deacylase